MDNLMQIAVDGAKQARERARLIQSLSNLAERYHGDAGCAERLFVPDNEDGSCPACEALDLLDRL